MSLNAQTTADLNVLRQRLPEAAQLLKLDLPEQLNEWMHALDVKLLPRLSPQFPLIAAICGGGSAGKSTLFNSLVGRPVSSAGGRAGINRRVLASVNDQLLRHPDFLPTFCELLGGSCRILDDPKELMQPGEPLYFSHPAAPKSVVLLDTPDIDTGARGGYTNRQAAQMSLEASDIFIYIFTNATYNNRDNTDFIARMLTGIGTRPCFLVYRVYAGFSNDEVLDHARTVAANIYGSEADRHVLGIYRADEENAVAAGEKAMSLRPVTASPPELSAALAAIDSVQLRRRLLFSIYADAVRQAAQIAGRVRAEREKLQRYIEVISQIQQRCVQEALSHFPTDRVLRRFARIWLDSDPAHIKFMRRTGRIVEWPYKTIAKAVKLIQAPPEEATGPQTDPDASKALEIDLLNSANLLYQQSLERRIEAGGRQAEVQPVLEPARQRLREKDWKTTLVTIQEQTGPILSWSQQLENDLKKLADDLRGRMGLFDQVRQTFSALLNVLPATAAITYILSTGDPVGAAGIKIKLTGFFGLHDLYALIAIPATAGMKSADEAQLQEMLAPVARTWLQHKLQAVDQLFEEQISGDLLNSARSVEQRLADMDSEIEQALARCQEVL